MDDSHRIAIALQVLGRRHRALDVEALTQVMRARWPEDVLSCALERGFGFCCGSEAAGALAAEVSEERLEEARALLSAENMADLFAP